MVPTSTETEPFDSAIGNKSSSVSAFAVAVVLLFNRRDNKRSSFLSLPPPLPTSKCGDFSIDAGGGNMTLERTFKKKAPKAIKEIRKFAEKAMGTKDVRVDVKLNKQIWSRGIRGPPRRIRVRVARKRNDDEDAKEEFFSLVTVAEIPAEGLSGLGTKVIDEED
ncbi:hypothetical protein F2Q68_00000938 [Brassica cretica]|uniref:60S ribosomal protein L31 n=1 Tax=Brassica cretica TaxID=69181 RepID=A0A8S9JFN0_BRACR|nr:hypothetical protein F2Q68_00000938 [Brassica cretica]